MRTGRKTHSVNTNPPVRRGRPMGDHEAKRAELLKAAASVIAQEGYAAASLRKVAQRAGCTTGAVTYYFASKDEMGVAVAERMWDEFDAWLEEYGGKMDILALTEQFLVGVNAGDSELWLVTFQLLVQARQDPVIAAIIQQRYARFRHVLTALVARGQSQGLVRSDLPANLLADQLSAITDGWMMMFPIEPDRFKPRRIKVLLDSVMTLISPPSGHREQLAARPGDSRDRANSTE